MKIRNGFISNSSSTSFTFFIKEDKLEDIFSLMLKYDQYFDLYTDIDLINGEKHCDVSDIIDEMRKIKDNLEIEDISILEKEIERDLKQAAEEQKQDKQFMQTYLDWEMELIDKKILVEDAKKKGFANYLKIGFGDNDGDISGGVVGTIMDYEGREIHINKPDFIVITEQNR